MGQVTPTLTCRTEVGDIRLLAFFRKPTLVPGMCDPKSGPAKSSDKLRSQSITSKFHRTSGTRLIREMFKQDSKRKRVISPTLENSHGDSTVPSPVYPFDACSTKHSNLVS